ncbi:MAG: amidohydrolase [Acidobacteria bacterium]|nr:amidohydrolase [Acidobacteriota bacterium]MYG76335.1 amidohydrolase [Acidobacteriota bacterium]
MSRLLDKNLSRAEFLKLSGAAAAAGLSTACGAGGGSAAPQLIVHNARVYTSEYSEGGETMDRAQALAVNHGKFVAVGSDEDVLNLAGPGTDVVDAGGMTVVPGFIDAHCHPGGMRDLFEVNLDVRTIEDIKMAIRAAAADTQPGYWVDGFKYDDTKVTDEKGEYRRITRQDLDEATTDVPVRVSHRGGHIYWYNSKAFEMAGITKDVADPPGGRFEKDADGELTGLVEEKADDVFDGVGQRRVYGRAEFQQGVAHMSKLMTAAGITSVHQTGGDADGLRALEDAYAAGDLRYRMYYFAWADSDLHRGLKEAGIHRGFGNEWVRIGAIKYGADGSASGRTMYMSTPYEGTDDHGILTMTPEEIMEAVEDSHAHDFHIGIHANGDLTIGYVLDAYEKVLAEAPREARHRIEHCSLVNPALLQRIHDSGSIPTPFWTYVHYHGNKWVAYGEEKMKWMFAHKSFLDYDIKVAGASDYVPGPYEPMMALQAMVTRKDTQGRVWGGNQMVTMDEALRIGTINGAWASFEEDIKGSIKIGKLADFVMLEQDPHDVAADDPDQLKHIAIHRTVVGGKTMFQA